MIRRDPTFALGLEACLHEPPRELRGARFGLLVNQASVDRSFRFAHELLAERFPGRLAALFGPQHGLWSEQQDDMIETAHGSDAALRVPIHSLYGETRTPTPEMLEGLDLLVVDLQDVGTRVYTYVWTLSLCLEACARRGLPVLVLDRPNPLGAVVVEGPALDLAFASFVGRAPIPMRHALTMAELARVVNDLLGIGADVRHVPLRGYDPRARWPDLGLAWVPTSPNLPRFESVAVYPGQVLLEGTNLSEGRGTTTPFEICGAPWLDGRDLRERLAPVGLRGVALRPIRFEPTFHKFANTSCGGVFVHELDASFRPYATTLALLAAMRSAAPDRFRWKEPPYEYEHVLPPIDILSGSRSLRLAIDAGSSPAQAAELARVDLDVWRSVVAPHLLYGGDERFVT